MHARTRKMLLSLLAALLLVAGLWWRSTRDAVVVETAVVTREDFEDRLSEDARTRVRWHLDVTAPVSGSWTPVALRPADTVRAGALLGTLTSAAQDPATAAQARARVGATGAALAAARAAAAEAVLQARDAARLRDRTERLVSAGGVSEEDLERVRTADEAARRQVELTRAQVRSAEFELRAAEAFLSGGAGRAVRLTAPSEGVVLRVDEEHERVVPAGAPLLQLGALGSPEIIARVLSTDAPRVAVGAALYAIVGRDTLPGHVTRIEPTAHTVRSALGVEEQRVNVVGDLHADSLRLGNDYQLPVQIVLRRLPQQLVIPSGALVRRGDRWSVFVVGDDGQVREQAIELVGRGAERAAIRGLAVGTVVVLYPPAEVGEGVRVRTAGG